VSWAQQSLWVAQTSPSVWQTAVLLQPVVLPPELPLVLVDAPELPPVEPLVELPSPPEQPANAAASTARARIFRMAVSLEVVRRGERLPNRPAGASRAEDSVDGAARGQYSCPNAHQPGQPAHRAGG